MIIKFIKSVFNIARKSLKKGQEFVAKVCPPPKPDFECLRNSPNGLRAIEGRDRPGIAVLSILPPSSSRVLYGLGVPRIRYVQVGRLGLGAFASVYKAVSLFNGKEVAIKMFTNARTRLSLASFNRELAALRRVSSLPWLRGLVDVIDSQTTSTLGFAMDLCQGKTVERLREEAKDKKLSEGVVKGLVRQVLQTLRELHNRGVVHRDIKPANLMVDERGLVTVVDLGVACVSRHLSW